MNERSLFSDNHNGMASLKITIEARKPRCWRSLFLFFIQQRKKGAPINESLLHSLHFI